MKTLWQVKSYTSSLGETGDQFTESWIENGELKLIASSDLESDEELHEIANALNSFETLDQQNKEFRERIAVVLSDSALGVEIQRLTTENKELEEKLMSEQIENGYLQAFKVSNEAEIQRLTKELQEAKTSDGRGWKAVERLQRANDVLRNENDKLKDQLIILKKAYGSKKTNNA